MYSKGSVGKPISQKGYLCGAFLPKSSPLYTEKLEVAWKEIGPQIENPEHYHKEADELTIVIEGSLKEKIDGELIELKSGEFILIKSGSIGSTVWAEEGTTIIVVKAPSIPNDKYLS